MTPMRIRAGILEHASVELLRSVGLGDRLAQSGIEHRGIYLPTSGDRHHLDSVDLVGRSVWVYGQKGALSLRAAPEVNRSSTAPTRSICTTSRPTGRM
jgi:2-polyprenyl-6-methoxyphenol hydroxylase-like FAD-dependent oxidoreductase